MKLSKRQKSLINALLTEESVMLSEGMFKQLVEEMGLDESFNEFEVERVGRSLLNVDLYHLDSGEVYYDIPLTDLVFGA